MGERRGDEQDVVAPEPQVLDLHRRRAGERVEAVQDALGLAGRPRREQQLGDRVGLRRAGGDRLGVGLLLLGRRREVVPLHAGARQQVDVLTGAGHEHVLDGEAFLVGQQRLGLGQVVAPAEALGHDEHARLRAAQRVGHLAAPEDRHERAAHGADAQRRDRQHDELAPVRQLVGDRLARLHAEAQQQRRRPVGGLVQRAPAPRARPVGADVDDRRLRRALASPAAHPLGDRDLGRLVDRDRLDLQLVAGGAALAALRDLHRDPDRRHVVDERGIGDPVRVGVREAARALRARRRDRERHLDAVVVVARQRGAGHAPHPVDDERVVDELDVTAHPVELQHGDDAVGLLQADVLDVLEHGPAGREGPERREDRQHVGHRPAVDAHAAQLDAVVPHPHPACLRVELHRQAHLGEHVEDVRLGVVDLRAERRAHPPEEDVGRVQRAGGEAERRRADVRRQDDLRRRRLLAGLDLEAAPVVGDPDLEPEVAHHPHGQLDVGLLVEDAVDLDDGRPRGERRQQEQAGDPLRQRPGDPDVPARRPRRLDGDRRPGVLGLQAHAELRRARRAADRPAGAGSTSGPSASPARPRAPRGRS